MLIKLSTDEAKEERGFLPRLVDDNPLTAAMLSAGVFGGAGYALSDPIRHALERSPAGLFMQPQQRVHPLEQMQQADRFRRMSGLAGAALGASPFIAYYLANNRELVDEWTDRLKNLIRGKGSDAN